MLNLLQKTLYYIEAQNEWLLQLQNAFAKKQESYQLLHSMITKEILNELEKQTFQDVAEIKQESCYNFEIFCKDSVNANEPVKNNTENDCSTDMAKNYEDFSNLKDEQRHVSSTLSTSTTGMLVATDTDVNKNLPISVTNDYIDAKQEYDELPVESVIQYEVVNENISMETVETDVQPTLKLNTTGSYNNQTSTSSSRFKCSYCNKAFKFRASLTNHVHTHTGEKPYKCYHCEKCFAQISTRNKHARIHTGEKPFKCFYCDKLFRDSGNRNQHLVTHTSVKNLNL